MHSNCLILGNIYVTFVEKAQDLWLEFKKRKKGH